MAVTINTQPAAQAVTQGELATFTVDASGTAPLTYQWRRDGDLLIGETTDTLQFIASLLDDGAAYDAIVSDVDGPVTSDGAELTVNPASTIAPVIQGPYDKTVEPGENALFSVSVFGTGPYRYEWRVVGGGAVPGGNDRTLTVLGLTSRDGMQYECIATDVSGLATTSQAATLTVAEPDEDADDLPRWPAYLPGVLVGDNQFSDSNAASRNPLVSGPLALRPRDRDGYTSFNVGWSLSAGELQVFRNWFRHVLKSGARRFHVDLMIDGASEWGGVQTKPHICKFDGEPDITQNGRRWRVSAVLWSIERPTLGPCAQLPAIFDAFDGDIPSGLFDDPPVTPPDPDLPPECQPYACDAVVTYLEQRGVFEWWRGDVSSGAAPNLVSPGQNNPALYLNAPDSSQYPGSQKVLDSCVLLDAWSSIFEQTQFNSDLSPAHAVAQDALGLTFIFIGKYTSVDVFDERALTVGLPVRFQNNNVGTYDLRFALIDSGATDQWRMRGGRIEPSGNFLEADFNDRIVSEDANVWVLSLDRSGNGQVIARAWVNGVPQANAVFTPNNFQNWETAATNGFILWGFNTLRMGWAIKVVDHVAWQDADVQRLQLEFERNFTGYNPPGYCANL